ncbi:hypothetical protein [Actinophytocola glycyrrhizae]
MMPPMLEVFVATAAPDVVAQLSTSSGTGLRDIALAIIGTFTIVILAGRAAGALADERYGKLLWLVLGAIPVIGFAYFPDLSVSIIKGLFTSGVG